jgi:hypothetical protein
MPRLVRLRALPAAGDGRLPALLASTVAVAAAFAVAAAEYTDAFRALNNRAAHNAALSEDGRNLEIADTLGISPAFVRAALALPPDATYAVETGPGAATRTPLALSALPGYLENLLLPRRRVPEGAEWLLCYGCELPPRELTVTWREDGLVVARLPR